MQGPDGEAQPFHGGLEQPARGGLGARLKIQVGRFEVGVPESGAPRAAREGDSSSAVHALPNRLRRLAQALLEVRPRHRGHGDVQVDPVEQRPGELSPVTGALREIAAAGAHRVSREPAGARVHRRDEQEVARVGIRAAHAHDRNALLFDRLADRLENVAPELGKLV